MPDPQPKLVQVNGLGVVHFPGDMDDAKISDAIKKHLSQTHTSSPKFTSKTTEEGEHQRQLTPAKSLSTALPTIPDWAKRPLLSDADLAESPEAAALTKKSQAEFKAEHPKIEAALEKGDNPTTLGVLEGVKNFTGGMTSPENLALLISAPESKLLSAVFATQAMRGSYKDVQEAQKAYEQGNNQEATQKVTEALLGLGVAGMAGHHAVKDIPVSEGVKDFVKSEEGSVGPQGPEDAKASLKKARDEYSALKPETVEAYNKALENYKLSTKAGMRQFLEKQIGQAKTPGDLKDVDELERMYTLQLKTVADVKAKASELKPTTAYKTADQSQPFYLKSENLINEKMKGPMPADDIYKMLISNGVKPEEMQWTGLNEFLVGKGKQKVTPQEIQEHLAGNNLQVQEVTKGAALGAKNPNELSVEEYGKPYDQLDAYQQRYIDTITEAHDKASPHATKFGSYVLPGAEKGSYRELLVTLPRQQFDPSKVEIKRKPRGVNQPSWETADIYYNGKLMREDVDDYDATDPESEQHLRNIARDIYQQGRGENSDAFRSSHWDEPNVVGHIRFNDRTGPNGEKLLHLEELQSDWHQKGRTQGYKTEVTKEQRDAAYKKVGDADRLLGELRPTINQTLSDHDYLGFDTLREAAAAVGEYPDFSTRWDVKDPSAVSNLQKYHDAWQQAKTAWDEKQALDRARTGGVPDAPFKKTWPELLMKRMVRYASDHGYDGVSWTPGDAQAERYDLSKQVDAIHYRSAGPRMFTVEAYRQGVGTVLSQTGTPEELEGVVGKDIVRKMVAKEGEEVGGPGDFRKLTGVDLKVGGEGMKGFYDKIVPEAANKLGKQFGAKVGETKIDTIPGGAREFGDVEDRKENPDFKKKTVPYLPITPQMRTGIKSIPYSLFTVPIAAAVLSSSQPKANAAPMNKGTIAVTDPNNHIHYFPDEKSASAFRRAAGIR